MPGTIAHEPVNSGSHADPVAEAREVLAELREVVSVLRRMTEFTSVIDAMAREDERALIFAGKRPRSRRPCRGRADLRVLAGGAP